MSNISMEGSWKRLSLPSLVLAHSGSSMDLNLSTPLSSDQRMSRRSLPKKSKMKRVKMFFGSTLGLVDESSNANFKSAPVSPIEETETKADSYDGTNTQAEASPSHAFTKTHRHAIKQLSSSTPAMTHAQTLSRPPAGEAILSPPTGDKASATTADSSTSLKSPPPQSLMHIPGTSKARQKKFLRHFKQVGLEERVLNYYSCALVGDILLQGHLYITKNYFAFYSNVFGYVTKLLIPTVDVLKVSKEKTAKIIPNAVGISTEEEKHVFGSLLSRESTYTLMVQVWKAATNPVIDLKTPVVLKNDVEDSASGDMVLDDESSVSDNEDRLSAPAPLTVVTSPETFPKLLPKGRKAGSLTVPILNSRKSSKEYWSVRKSTSILAISTALLISLFISASFLLYRVSTIQAQISDFPFASNGEDIYEEILKWQTALHARSTNEVHEFVNTNLNQIAKVRLSLEALSMLILNTKEPYDGSSSKMTSAGDSDKVS